MSALDWVAQTSLHAQRRCLAIAGHVGSVEDLLRLPPLLERFCRLERLAIEHAASVRYGQIREWIPSIFNG